MTRIHACLEKGGDKGTTYARVQTKTNVPKQLKMATYDPEVIKSWLVSLTTESLELGNGEFGDKVRVYGGNSPESAERVFPPAFQKLMLELLER